MSKVDLGAAPGERSGWGRYLLIELQHRPLRIVATTDIVGSINFVYESSPRRLVAGTAESMVRSLASSRRIEPVGLASVLLHGHCLGPWTVTEGVRCLLGDSCFTWQPGTEARSEQFSTLHIDERMEQMRDADALAEELGRRVAAAVLTQAGERPTWSLFLSGGVDSRLILAYLMDLGKDIRLVSYGYRGFPDLELARLIARRTGIPHVSLGHQDGYFARAVLEEFYSMFGPSLAPYNAIWAPLAKELPDDLRNIGQLHGYLGMRTSHFVRPPIDRAIHVHGDLHGPGAFTREELGLLLRFDVREVEAELERQANTQRFPRRHQNVWYNNLIHRQRRYVSSQVAIIDHVAPCVAPYLDRDYMSFWLSVDPAFLGDHIVLRSLYSRRFPELAAIPSTSEFFGLTPRSRPRWALDLALSRLVPRGLRGRLLPDRAQWLSELAVGMRAGRPQVSIDHRHFDRVAFALAREEGRRLTADLDERWFHLDRVAEIERSAAGGSQRALTQWIHLLPLAYTGSDLDRAKD